MRTVAITIGVFDMLHEGHVNLFKAMEEASDAQVVVVHDDFSTWQNKKKFPVQNLKHRMDNILAGDFATFIMEVDKPDPTEFIFEMLKEWRSVLGDEVKYVFMRGDDWQEFPGKKALEELGVEIRYVPYTKGISSTKLREEL